MVEQARLRLLHEGSMGSAEEASQERMQEALASKRLEHDDALAAAAAVALEQREADLEALRERMEAEHGARQEDLVMGITAAREEAAAAALAVRCEAMVTTSSRMSELLAGVSVQKHSCITACLLNTDPTQPEGHRPLLYRQAEPPAWSGPSTAAAAGANASGLCGSGI